MNAKFEDTNQPIHPPSSPILSSHFQFNFKECQSTTLKFRHQMHYSVHTGYDRLKLSNFMLLFTTHCNANTEGRLLAILLTYFW